MSAKSIAHRASSISQRQRTRDVSVEDYMESRAMVGRNRPTREEVVCRHWDSKFVIRSRDVLRAGRNNN